MDGEDAGVESLFLRPRQGLLGGADLAAVFDEGGKLLVFLGKMLGERVLRRNCHERGAENRVVARREDQQFLELLGQLGTFQGKGELQALGTTDPIALRGTDEIGPSADEAVERAQQLL